MPSKKRHLTGSICFKNNKRYKHEIKVLQIRWSRLESYFWNLDWSFKIRTYPQYCTAYPLILGFGKNRGLQKKIQISEKLWRNYNGLTRGNNLTYSAISILNYLIYITFILLFVSAPPCWHLLTWHWIFHWKIHIVLFNLDWKVWFSVVHWCLNLVMSKTRSCLLSLKNYC